MVTIHAARRGAAEIFEVRKKLPPQLNAKKVVKHISKMTKCVKKCLSFNISTKMAKILIPKLAKI